MVRAPQRLEKGVKLLSAPHRNSSRALLWVSVLFVDFFGLFASFFIETKNKSLYVLDNNYTDPILEPIPKLCVTRAQRFSASTGTQRLIFRVDITIKNHEIKKAKNTMRLTCPT